jgi:hypothetical protein
MLGLVANPDPTDDDSIGFINSGYVPVDLDWNGSLYFLGYQSYTYNDITIHVDGMHESYDDTTTWYGYDSCVTRAEADVRLMFREEGRKGYDDMFDGVFQLREEYKPWP